MKAFNHFRMAVWQKARICNTHEKLKGENRSLRMAVTLFKLEKLYSIYFCSWERQFFEFYYPTPRFVFKSQSDLYFANSLQVCKRDLKIFLLYTRTGCAEKLWMPQHWVCSK